MPVLPDPAARTVRVVRQAAERVVGVMPILLSRAPDAAAHRRPDDTNPPAPPPRDYSGCGRRHCVCHDTGEARKHGALHTERSETTGAGTGADRSGDRRQFVTT